MRKLLKKTRKGSVLLYSVILMMVLVISGGAFMKWAADEAYQANLDLARTQAYYIAQQGAIEQGIGKLRNQKIYQLPQNDLSLPDGPEDDYGQYVGKYTDTWLLRDEQFGENENEFVKTGAWDATAVGRVYVPQRDGNVVAVERRFTMRSQMRTFANYMYLSDIETAQAPDSSGDEVIWFYNGDTLYGRVHSNDWIGLKGSPHFYGPVSTSKEDFLRNNENAHFEYDPQFEVPEVYFPETAQDVRDGALSLGTYINNNNGQYTHKVYGQSDGWHWVRWETGNGIEPTDDNIIEEGLVSYGQNTLMFFEGRLYVEGEHIQLRNTVACGGNMYLTNNVKYQDVGYPNPVINEESPNILGLISEGNIVIRNNAVNGTQNGGAAGESANHDNAHIVITAGMVALGESFTFEHQNDPDPNDPSQAQPAPWDHGNYLWCPPGSGAGNDERGYIYLRGALAQKRRGYVHRSNCGGTGYFKSYDYDFRLQTNPPPVYLAAQDEDGNVFFEVTNSWDSTPKG